MSEQQVHVGSLENTSGVTGGSGVTQDSSTGHLDELSDTELIQIVEDLETETKRLDLENQIFENFLLASEPTLIAGMAQTLESAQKMRSMKYKSPFQYDQVLAYEKESPDQSEVGSIIKGSTRYTPSASIIGTLPKAAGARINLSHKTDLVLREIEEMQISLQKFIKKSHKIKFKLKAEIEESAIRDAEVKEAIAAFEQNIVIGGVDKLTQKIPAEKFVRYMQEWLKSAQFILEKLRLRTSSIKIQHSKLKNLLVQKEEIGESVHEVDFEKLRIENKHLLLKIDQKNNHLLELKRMNGKANLMLTTHKKVLQQQAEELSQIKTTVADSERRISELEMEAELAEQEVEKENNRIEQLKTVIENYRAPDVMEYINKKYDLVELRKVLKTWTRKCTIQKTAIETYTRNLTHITGIKKPRPSWFDFYRKTSDINFLEGYQSGSNSSSIETLPDQEGE